MDDRTFAAFRRDDANYSEVHNVA